MQTMNLYHSSVGAAHGCDRKPIEPCLGETVSTAGSHHRASYAMGSTLLAKVAQAHTVAISASSHQLNRLLPFRQVRLTLNFRTSYH